MNLIPGLRLIKDYISREEERELIVNIDSETWDDTLKRRTQQYGYEYSFKTKNITGEVKPIPKWADNIINRVKTFFPRTPEQIIINEYLPGQGISKHIDSLLFDEPVVSLSLLSSCVMNFIHNEEKIPLLLEPRSLLIMSGDSRWLWYHEIPPRKYDVIDGIKILRGRRVSMTFRCIRI